MKAYRQNTMFKRIAMAFAAAFIVFPAIFAPLKVVAQDTQRDPAGDLIAEHWLPAPGLLKELAARAKNEPGILERTEDGMGSLAQSATSILCKLLVAEIEIDDEYCRYKGKGTETAIKLLSVLKDRRIASILLEIGGKPLVQTVTAVDDGRFSGYIASSVKVASTPFDVAMGLEFVRWRTAACNFKYHADGGEYEESVGFDLSGCDDLPFFAYMENTLCPDDGVGCDYEAVSWMFGFLTRRYLSDGVEEVEAWQQIMQRVGELADKG